MLLSIIRSHKTRIIQYLLFLGTAAAVVAGLAQSGKQVSTGMVIDGENNPEQVPEFILWEQLFQMAIQLEENAATDSHEFWTQKLNVSKDIMNDILALAYEHREMLEAVQHEARLQITNAEAPNSALKDHPNKKEALKGTLKGIQLNREAQTLEMRDRLRDRIGEDAYLKLSSFIQLQIAPRTKLGNRLSAQ